MKTIEYFVGPLPANWTGLQIANYIAQCEEEFLLNDEEYCEWLNQYIEEL